MLVKKPATLLSACNGINSIYSSNHYSDTSSSCLISRRSATSLIQRTSKLQSRSYAKVAENGRKDYSSWPESPQPTPYQIFNQRKNAPYSKQQFYELVKLYHPDRNSPDMSSEDRLVKLERYRLIVAANLILSDPIRRNAYDRYGAGWNGQPETRSSAETYGSSQSWQHSGERKWDWRSEHSPSQNATWEDWERWYQRDEKGQKAPQVPLYFSNSAFVSLIIAFAALGGIGQATRTENFSLSLLESRDRVHRQSSQDLVRRRRETYDSCGDKDQRIDEFLKTRDPIGCGVTDHLEEAYCKLLPSPELCSSADVKDRSLDVYQDKEDGKGR
jgi:hypothetical protein